MGVESTSMITDVVVPLILQSLISAVTLGFTSSDSLARHASIPVSFYFVHCIWSTGGVHLRRSWANVILCFSAGMQLHYLDIALLSQWTYEQNPYRRRAQPSFANGHSSSPKRTNKPPVQSSLREISSRFVWGLMALVQNRRLNTTEEVKDIMPLPEFASSSKLKYLVYASAKLAMLYLLCDVLLPDPPLDLNTLEDMFAARKVPIFSRLVKGETIGLSEIGTRAAMVLHFWVFSYAAMSILILFVSVITVALGVSQPKAWKPFFGSPFEAYTIRGFWGRSWHQALRNSLGNPAKWIVEDLCGLKAIKTEQRCEKWLGKYAKVMLTFAISGCLHVFVESAAGCGFFASGTMRYFLMQGTGIVVEDHAQQLFATVTGLGGSSTPKWWEKAVGFAWVALFQLWTTPSWTACTGPGASSEPRPLLPVSVVGLIRGSWAGADAVL